MMNARKLLLTQLHLLRAQSFHRQLREAISGDGRAERPALQVWVVTIGLPEQCAAFSSDESAFYILGETG
jgi:hypothetical protein